MDRDLNHVIRSMFSISFLVPQSWVTSTEEMSGIFTSERKVADYEQIWHKDVFMPCLKKLRTEVCMDTKIVRRV